VCGVERKDSEGFSVRSFEVNGVRDRGRAI